MDTSRSDLTVIQEVKAPELPPGEWNRGDLGTGSTKIRVDLALNLKQLVTCSQGTNAKTTPSMKAFAPLMDGTLCTTSLNSISPHWQALPSLALQLTFCVIRCLPYPNTPTPLISALRLSSVMVRNTTRSSETVSASACAILSFW